LNAHPERRTRLILKAAAAVMLLTAVVIGLAAVILGAPTKDLLFMLIFLPVSGGLSLAVCLVPASLQPVPLLKGIRGKLLLAGLLSAFLVMVNVGFIAVLMFISSHDLGLLLLMLLFALGVSCFFAFTVAEGFQRNLSAVLSGVRQLSGGDFQARVEVQDDDDLREIALALNAMAAELRAASQSRQEMEDARRQLIGAVSHDLRTPLATMRAMVESISDGIVTDPETIARYHASMQREIAYLSRLIDDLFELSQIDSGLLQLRPESGSIGDLVSDTLEALRPQAEQRSLRLSGDVPAYLPSVLMDTPRIQRVLYNLVQNALRHTPADGSVVIRASACENEVQVSVEDTGEGLEPEELPRIFERFYRGSQARNRSEAGSGLGLTIAKAIVELHGGRIWAAVGQNRGAVFTFTLPSEAD
jgi:signal transduction histidine kinase